MKMHKISFYSLKNMKTGPKKKKIETTNLLLYISPFKYVFFLVIFVKFVTPLSPLMVASSQSLTISSLFYNRNVSYFVIRHTAQQGDFNNILCFSHSLSLLDLNKLSLKIWTSISIGGYFSWLYRVSEREQITEEWKNHQGKLNLTLHFDSGQFFLISFRLYRRVKTRQQ
jgi:hypothetical protein